MKRILAYFVDHLKKRGLGKLVLFLFSCFIFVAVIADFLANERPIYCTYGGKSYFPVFHQYLEALNVCEPYDFMYQKSWSEIDYESRLMPIVPFSPNTIYHSEKPYSPPLTKTPDHRKIHLLGTDQVGRDVASGLIHGTRIALKVGLLSMLIASVIGIFLGGTSGYFGDHKTKVSRILIIIFLMDFSYILFLLTYGEFLSQIGILILILLLSCIIVAGCHKGKLKFLSKRVNLPFDLLVMRFIEIFKALPALFVLLALVALIQRASIYTIILIIGLLKWPSIARLVRAEMLRIREMDYILASKALGQSSFRIFWKHALPNALQPALVAIAFGVSSAIILEATISFLGLGLGVEDVSWGSLLSEARRNFAAWWLAIFPGLLIFLMVFVFNNLGDFYNEMREGRIS